MLYKNGELYKLTPEDKKRLVREINGFPVRIKYPDNRIKKNSKNPRPDEPASISIPMVANVRTDMGSEEWRYAENRIDLPDNGGVRWTPHNLLLQSKRTLTEKDVELVYWLIYACPYLENGKNWNGRVPKISFEDLLGSANRKATRESDLAEVKTLIYNDKLGLGEDKVRLLAKAYFINNVDELSINQVRIALDQHVFREKTDGMEKFKELVDAEQTLKIKANIQMAVDHRIITFNRAKKSWYWVSDEGRNEKITTITLINKPNQALFDYYNGNAGFAELLTGQLVAKELIKEEVTEE